MEASFVLIENYTSARGSFTGTSYNYHDIKSKLWKQVWIDNQGGNLELHGNYHDGKMILESEELYNEKNKTIYKDRITWTKKADGTVRQHWQQTTDKGKTWTTVFDGLYKPKPEKD